MFKDKLKTAVSQSLLGMQAELLAKMKDTERSKREMKQKETVHKLHS